MGNRRRGGALDVLLTSLKLGLTSFGGPIAHIGYFREAYVKRKQWLDEPSFADLTALCQFLPGPASSQLGIGVGLQRAGLLGGLAAWAGFTLPSAALLVAFAWGVRYGDVASRGWLHGLMLAAVAVVAQAVWSMAKSLAPDRPRATMAIATAVAALLVPGAAGQLLPMAACALAGIVWLQPEPTSGPSGTYGLQPVVRPGIAIAYLAVFAALLVGLPLLAAWQPTPLVQLADSGYRAGSLVFGGGHVILPMLQEDEAVSRLVGPDAFLAGYGAAQAVPGPLFTFTAYLGAVSAPGAEGLVRAVVMLVAVFLPSFLLVAGTLPFWARLRANATARRAMAGLNASVVGILLAALYDPVFVESVSGPLDAAAALTAFLFLTVWQCPPWLLAAAAAAAGALLF